jgi:hypothetical protein
VQETACGSVCSLPAGLYIAGYGGCPPVPIHKRERTPPMVFFVIVIVETFTHVQHESNIGIGSLLKSLVRDA